MRKLLCVALCFAGGCAVTSSDSEPPGVAGDVTAPSGLAKNVILFVGDGMGVSTVTAARIFDGQSKGMPGEENLLAFESFPNVALVKTYNTNQQVPDSAGTMTAMMTGTKTRAGVINVGPAVPRQSCVDAKRAPLVPLGHIAKEKGKAVGVVTTTTLTHATPAAVYAISPERGWESDAFLGEAAEQGCRDIAHQLTRHELDVALGGGRAHFFGSEGGGIRRDPGADLPAVWKANRADRAYVENAAQLAAQPASTQLLGLFSRSHMTYVAERGDDTTEPSLRDMTAAAIRHLSQGEAGYFLMVEGGRIDHGHHQSLSGYAMLETQALAQAVETAVEMVDLRDTLILVTADHSHVFTIAGYPTRGNPILGHVVGNDARGEPEVEPAVDAMGTPYTTLGYANGPGAVVEGPRPVPETGESATFQSLVPTGFAMPDGSQRYIETHAGEDVALYGVGPGSQRVRGVLEQNRVFDIIVAAFGW